MSLTPIYIERVWGGRGLELKLGRTPLEGKVIGESRAKLKKGRNYLQPYVTGTPPIKRASPIKIGGALPL